MISNMPFKTPLKDEIKYIVNGQAKFSASFLNWVATIIFGAGIIWASVLEIPTIKNRQNILEKDLNATKNDITEMKTDIKWICRSLGKK